MLDRSRSRNRSKTGDPFSPAGLFVTGAQGAWYDPSDYSTLFQDAAGTTPVTAVEQPVRLMLDRSRGLVLGGELVTNGTFDSGTTGWTAYRSTLTAPGGRLRITEDGVHGGAFARQEFAVTNGKSYLFSVDVLQISGPSKVQIWLSSVNYQGADLLLVDNITTPQTISRIFRATSSSVYIELLESVTAGGTTEFSEWDNVSVRELPGNHAVAPNDASRPVLRARYNLLTFSEQFDNAAWIKSNVGVAAVPTVTANAGTAPDGTATADRVQYSLSGGTTSGDISQLYQTNATTGVMTHSVYLKSFDGVSSYVMQIVDSTGVGQPITVTGEWQRFSVSATSAGAINYAIRLYGGQSPTNSSTADVLIWGAQLLTAADQTATGGAYQRIAAATDYDVSNPVFRPYLAFDGTDDSFSTSTIDFSGTDEMTVFAGVTKLSDAARGMLVELSASYGNPGTFGVEVPTTPATADYGFISGGSVPAGGYAVASGFAAPITNVLTAIGDISADVTSLRLNGVAAATNTDNQGTGNYSNAALFIGRRNNSSNPLNGRLYSLAVLGRTATAPELSAMETWVNGKTGAY